MNERPTEINLKEINADKKKITWGDVPAIFHMTYGSVSNLDGILSYGFDNAFKRVLNKNNWNLELLNGYTDKNGNIQVAKKPKISLQHVYDEESYEIHCFPIIQGEKIHQSLLKHPRCSFNSWLPESMRILFRINSLVSFIFFSFKRGDAADIALIKYAHIRVTKLIGILNESFDIIEISGYSIAEFCQEIDRRKNLNDTTDLYDNSNN
jgi:hypothetical protein